ncbi:carbohydrate sulfotransferase 15-like isoform X1 [Saccostrea echinata]|uniref:carbohydrate sulfotransferase 15-like isoform X1 n=1 Tax=Saccostrea echinata TaxID=191078 RepID=UPI002A7EC8B9|nr:carbohydrate sulfotransferase 15-like isoform X1 [Saccostrea echinata]
MSLKLLLKWKRRLYHRVTKRKSSTILCIGLSLLIIFPVLLPMRFVNLLYHRSVPNYQCGVHRNPYLAEDILCQERKKFLPNFKNPCWYEFDGNVTYNKLRCLPYFHIFGVCKSGTTDLFFRLIQHPQIVPNRGQLSKETWFWSWHRYGTDLMKRNVSVDPKQFQPLDHFIDFFQVPQISQMKVSPNGSKYSDIVTGHADPMDFWDNTLWRFIPQNDENDLEPTFTTPYLIRHVQPNIRLILLLREPVERLYSQYYHLGFGSSPEDFHVDVSASIRYIDRCRRLDGLRSCLYNRTLIRDMPTPLYASFYDVHIANWLDAFPREQIFIVRTEDFSKDIRFHLLHLFKFLKVDDVSETVLKKMSQMSRRYKSVFKDKAGPMLNRTRRMLRDYFREPMKKLSYLLNDPKYTWADVYG